MGITTSLLKTRTSISPKFQNYIGRGRGQHSITSLSQGLLFTTGGRTSLATELFTSTWRRILDRLAWFRVSRDFVFRKASALLSHVSRSFRVLCAVCCKYKLWTVQINISKWKQAIKWIMSGIWKTLFYKLSTRLNKIKSNNPFYCLGSGDKALKPRQGWSWFCHDTNLIAFPM